jgi:hypothetical protein
MKAVHTPGLAELCWNAFDDETNQLLPGATPEYKRQGQFDVVVEPSGQKRFWFVCPGQCKGLSALAIRPVVVDIGNQHSWDWNGSTGAPTLTPSINHVGCWHGWLTDGEFKSC